jgi:hypothetical protein
LPVGHQSGPELFGFNLPMGLVEMQMLYASKVIARLGCS